MSKETESELPEKVYRYEDLRDYHQRFIDEYLIDLIPGKASVRAGFRKNAGAWMLQREDVRSVVEQKKAERAFRVNVTADQVLTELWQQYQRLLAMLEPDAAELMSEEGLKAIQEWPEEWRKGIMEELVVEPQFAYSKDGEARGSSNAWDRIGTKTKIKRPSRIAIEREIRETLRAIGEHVNVRAFERQQVVEVHLHAEIDRRIAEGRKRAFLERAEDSKSD